MSTPRAGVGTRAGQSARVRRAARGGAGSVVVALIGLAAATVPLPGCVAPQLLTLRSGLDSLRAVVDTLVVRDSIAYRVLEETRREIASQKDVLLSTRATAGSTTQELFEQMSRLEAKLDDVMGRFQLLSQRLPVATPGVSAPSAPEPNQLYDQAAQDLTQGRYGLALRGFRDFVQRFPGAELADNAQYGIGECFFAQSMFDSAAVEYARVESGYPQGDKVPAALYKRALAGEKLGQSASARKTLEDLVKRFPLSGEAQLSRERLGTTRRR